MLFLHLEELRREDRLAVSVFLKLEARGGVVAGLRLVCADNAAVFLNVDACNAACVAVDEVYRVYACCAAPAAVKLESRNFRVTCIDEPVIKILALVHIELVGVVVVADLDAVLLRNVAEAVEFCCNFFSFCLVAEICHRADDELCAQLCKVGENAFNLIQTDVSGIDLQIVLCENLLHFFNRHFREVRGELCACKTKLCNGLQLLNRANRLGNQGINLNIDIFHGKNHLSENYNVCGNSALKNVRRHEMPPHTKCTD